MLQAQPIMDLATGDTDQYELLLRMRDPLGELISPAAFLPVAERYDLIGAIDKWVVSRAIEMLGRGEPPRPPAHVRGQHLRPLDRRPGAAGADRARAAHAQRRPGAGHLRDHGDHGRREHPARAGVRRTTSTRSAAASRSTTSAPPSRRFYYLKHLPFDYLKIDGEFVRSCVNDRTDQLVIQAVVDIARGLGKRTVAEMVGDEETLELVRELGVDYAQGYHIGRPAPLQRWVVERNKARARRPPRGLRARSLTPYPARPCCGSR